MLLAFAVFDSKASAFNAPMFLATKGLALRAFSDACAAADSPLVKHSEDYSLFEIGSYDPNSGKLKSLAQPKHMVNASAVVELVQPKPSFPIPGAFPSEKDLKSFSNSATLNKEISGDRS